MLCYNTSNGEPPFLAVSQLGIKLQKLEAAYRAGGRLLPLSLFTLMDTENPKT